MTAASRVRPIVRVGVAAAALVATALVVPSAAAAGPDQITNGDFSNGFTGWVVYPAGEIVNGAGCNNVGANSGAYGAAIRQDNLPIIGGETYDLTFTAWAPTAADGETISYPRVVIQGDGAINYAGVFGSTKLALTNVPTTQTINFTVPAEVPGIGGPWPNLTLEFSQDVDNPVAYTFCLDDVSLIGGVPPEVYAPDTGPRVRVNQVAYLPYGPKGATVVTDATTPLPWELRDAADVVVASGSSVPRGVDPTAALNVHSIDFSAYTTEGTGLTLVADGETSRPFDIGAAAYEQLRKDALTFFYTNRSGIAIDDSLAPGYGRAAGHVGVAPNTGDTAVGCLPADDEAQALYDAPFTCDYTQDVSGGWYDAGDHGKYVVNGGISVAQLMQTYERTRHADSTDVGTWTDGSLSIPESSNGVPDLLDTARWELEWMLKMQVQPGRQYAGMAFHKVADLNWTGLPLDPAADPQPRALFRPSTAATLNLAAVAAQGARLFAMYDPAFASRLMKAARTAYAAANANPAIYAPAPDPTVDPNPGSGPYNDSDVSDEFYWAAAELFITTGEAQFRNHVQSSPLHLTPAVFTADGFSWDKVAALGALDLAAVPNGLPSRGAVKAQVLTAAQDYLADQANQPFGQAYEPPDLDYVWGSNSAILNNMQVIGTAYDLTGSAMYRHGVVRSMDYLLGRNALNLSYITGYGEVAAENQHSRMYANQVDASLPNPPAGTIAGGPNTTTLTTGDPVAGQLFSQGCVTQFCYVDDIGSWSTNEITVNWNAPLAWVASFVADQDSGGGLPTPTCAVKYRKNAQWVNGGTGPNAGPAFNATIVIKNTGTRTLDGWRLLFSHESGNQRVYNGWGGVWTFDGSFAKVRGESRIKPGHSVTIGFNARTGLANWTPEQFWLNGKSCG